MAAKDMMDAFRNPHPDVPLASVGDDTIQALSSPRDSSWACQRRPTFNPHSLIKPNLELAHAQQAANEITDDNSHSKHPQCAITSEGGHTSDTTSITYEGAHWLPAPLGPQPVSR
jgi:hypothetical protein